jgi:hypothetical protein
MAGKITAAVVAAILFSSAGVASAQTNRHSARISGHWQAPYSNSYYDRDYWVGVDGVAPGVGIEHRDPYAGTVFD